MGGISGDRLKKKRIKTQVIVEEIEMDTCGKLEILIGRFGTGKLENLRMEDLNKICFLFDMLKKPSSVNRPAGNSIVIYGFICFGLGSVSYPANMPKDLMRRIEDFFYCNGKAKPLLIDFNEIAKVQKIKETDTVEVHSSLKGITACFIARTLPIGDFPIVVYLCIKAVVELRILVSRFEFLELHNFNYQEDISDFEDE